MKKGLFIGRITKNAEWVAGRTGEFLSFDIAISNGKDKNGEWRPSTFVGCTMGASEWSEKLAQYLTKGTEVYVEGEPSAYAYINKEGKSIAGLRLSVRDVKLIGGKQDNATSSSNEDTSVPASEPLKGDDIPF